MNSNFRGSDIIVPHNIIVGPYCTQLILGHFLDVLLQDFSDPSNSPRNQNKSGQTVLHTGFFTKICQNVYDCSQ